MGGKQVITFLDSYATPLQSRSGLMYMNFLGKPTDADMAKYPTVILTAQYEWDPSVLDYTHPTSLEILFGLLTLQNKNYMILG